MSDPAASKPRVLPQRVGQAILTLHIMLSVGLLGDSAGFLAVALLVESTADPASAVQLVYVLEMFSVVFGIPLSFGALLTGIALGVGTKWGVFRYPWVTAKLALIVSVMAVGGLVIGPSITAMQSGAGDRTSELIAAAGYDVLALAVATTLSVFKPGGRFSRATAAPRC